MLRWVGFGDLWLETSRYSHQDVSTTVNKKTITDWCQCVPETSLCTRKSCINSFPLACKLHQGRESSYIPVLGVQVYRHQQGPMTLVYTIPTHSNRLWLQGRLDILESQRPPSPPQQPSVADGSWRVTQVGTILFPRSSSSVSPSAHSGNLLTYAPVLASLPSHLTSPLH